MYCRQWGGLQKWRHGSKMNLMCSQIGEESILTINPHYEELLSVKQKALNFMWEKEQYKQEWHDKLG